MIRALLLSVLLLAVAAPLAASAPAPPVYRDDGDGNRIADTLDARIAEARLAHDDPSRRAEALREVVRVELLFSVPVRDGHRAAIRHRGGRILAEEKLLVHVLCAEVPLGALEPLARELSDLLLIAPPEELRVRFALFADDGTPRWIGSRTMEEIERLLAAETLRPPGIATIEGAMVDLAAIDVGRMNALARQGFVVHDAEMPEELSAALEDSLQANLAARGEDFRDAWLRHAPSLRFHRLLAIALAEEIEPSLAVDAAMDATVCPLDLPATVRLETDGAWMRVLPARPDEGEPLFLSAASGADVEVALFPTGESVLLGSPSPSALRRFRLQANASEPLLEPDGEIVGQFALLLLGTGDVEIGPLPEPAEEATPYTTPTATPIATPVVLEDDAPQGPIALTPSPWREGRPRIDGRAESYPPPAIRNTARPESPLLQVANLRIAHDNDYLYLHVAGNFPATSDRPPAALWILLDSDNRRGVNPLTDNGAMGPIAATQGMEGTVLEEWFEADSMLFFENATSGRRDRYRLWWIDYAGESAQQLAEFGVPTPGPGALRSGVPVGFAAGFDNTGGFSVPADAERAATGLELRIPLSMAGLDAPLIPRRPRQELRLMVGAGSGETGAWSNQVLGPVSKVESLGGGAGRSQPDFRRNRTGDGALAESFSGVQTLAYPVEFVSRTATERSEGGAP